MTVLRKSHLIKCIMLILIRNLTLRTRSRNLWCFCIAYAYAFVSSDAVLANFTRNVTIVQFQIALVYI